MPNLPVPNPITWVTGVDVTAAQLNANVRDALNFLLNPPLFVGVQTTAQTINSLTWTGIQLQATVVDPYGAHSTTVNSQCIARVSGWYEMSGIVNFAVNATGFRVVRIVVNGTAVQGSATDTQANNADYTAIPSFATAYMNAGDYCELQALQSSGGGTLNTGVLADISSRFTTRWVHS